MIQSRPSGSGIVTVTPSIALDLLSLMTVNEYVNVWPTATEASLEVTSRTSGPGTPEAKVVTVGWGCATVSGGCTGEVVVESPEVDVELSDEFPPHPAANAASRKPMPMNQPLRTNPFCSSPRCLACANEDSNRPTGIAVRGGAGRHPGWLYPIR